METIEFALHQGAACKTAILKKRWPGLGVRLQHVVALEGGPLQETVELTGSEAPAAMEYLKSHTDEGGLVVLVETREHARYRLEVPFCPLVPVIMEQGLHPEVPVQVERDSDRWVIEDRPERVRMMFGALYKAGLLPKMVRRDPSRRR